MNASVAVDHYPLGWLPSNPKSRYGLIVAWTVILLVLLVLFMMARISGINGLLSRWAREEGDFPRARAIQISSALILGGMAVLLLGAALGSQVIVDIAFLLLALSIAPPLLYQRHRRRMK